MMRNFNVIGVHLKIRFLGRSMKNQYIGDELPKKGGLNSLQV